MIVSVKAIGCFFRALGETMIEQDDVCAGAILDDSRDDLMRRMTERIEFNMANRVLDSQTRGALYIHDFECSIPEAEAIINYVKADPANRIDYLLMQFGDNINL